MGLHVFRWMVIVAWVCWASPAMGVPGKTYSNVSLSNTNTETITGTVTYFSVFRSGINISDTTSYPGGRTFTNSGDVNLANFSVNSMNLLSLINNLNADVTIVNSGDLSFTFGPNDSTISFEGIKSPGSLVNSGALNFDVIHFGGYYDISGMGLFISGDSLVNSGPIRFIGRAGDVNVNGRLAISLATGIWFSGDTMVNSGDIRVEARAASVTGSSNFAYARAYGIHTQGDLLNTGQIEVEAHGGRERTNSSLPFNAQDARAYGIYVDDSVILDSRGLISAKAALYPGMTGAVEEAYQVYVNAGTTTVTGYAMALKNQVDFTQQYQGAIKVNAGAGLVFNNAVLYLSISPDFDGQARYEIPMLGEGAVPADQFASLGPLPPEYTVTLENQSGSGLQALGVQFSPQVSPPLASTAASADFNAHLNHMVEGGLINGVISDFLSSETLGMTLLSFVDAGHSPQLLLSGLGPGGLPGRISLPRVGKTRTFVSPVLLVSRDSDPGQGYDAHHYGILAGFTRSMGDAFLGAHAGVGDSQLDYTGAGYELRRETGDNYTLGVHGVYPWGDWLFSAIATAFYQESDYRDLAPSNVESAAYDSLSTRLDISLGRLFQWGRHTLFPELGFTHAWDHRESFTTRNLNHPDVHYGPLDAHELYGRMGVKYFVDIPLGKQGPRLLPFLGLALTQVLTDGEMSNTMQVGSLSRRVSRQGVRTRLSPKGGISLKGEDLELLAGYSGGFADDQEDHLFWFQLGVEF
ncbi:MAG: autotransporter outer membrane beta-barrel domain-containing protein [Desulfobacterales bacterium]|nr:autotransporter outer membrane beta-barrel domain-containing protein [Desulfobacterales bacterium]